MANVLLFQKVGVVHSVVDSCVIHHECGFSTNERRMNSNVVIKEIVEIDAVEYAFLYHDGQNPGRGNANKSGNSLPFVCWNDDDRSFPNFRPGTSDADVEIKTSLVEKNELIVTHSINHGPKNKASLDDAITQDNLSFECYPLERNFPVRASLQTVVVPTVIPEKSRSCFAVARVAVLLPVKWVLQSGTFPPLSFSFYLS